MEYTELDIVIKDVKPFSEILIARLNDIDFETFEENINGVKCYIQSQFFDLPKTQSILNKISTQTSLQYSINKIAQKNWNAEWESDYEPVNIEGRALVRAPFHAAPPSGLDIVIAPHMSFGTGHHDTTWLMIRTLLNLDVKGKKVLDMGCGTGVLAFTAMKLDASFVLAIDIEAGAYENTLTNAALNGCANEDRLSVKCGDATLLKQHHHHDLILANINRNILLKDLKSYDQVLNAGGNIALSGFFTGDVPVLQAAVKQLGWESLEVSESDGWACILCGKTQL